MNWHSILEGLIRYFSPLSTSDIISLGTLIVVAIYTAVTVRLWKETRFQTRLQINPLPIILYEESASQRADLHMENIGKGVALDVRLSDMMIVPLDHPSEYKLVFEPINILKPGCSVRAGYKYYIDGKEKDAADSFLPPFFFSCYQREHSFRFCIDYRNAIGEKYQCVFTIGKGGIRVKKIRKMTRLRALYEKCYEAGQKTSSRAKQKITLWREKK